MVQQRLLRRARLPRVELDPRSADLDARSAGRPGRSRREAELSVRRRRLLRIRGEEGDVVEVVLDVGRGLDEPEPHAFGQLEVRLAVARAIELEACRQLRQCGGEAGDAERNV